MNCGIYAIVNLLNGKRYIGSSMVMKKRRNSHFSELRSNTHHNGHLQNSFNKNGEEAFVFVILEETSPVGRLSREQWWLDNSSNLYNVRGTAESSDGYKRETPSDETRQRQSDALKDRLPVNHGLAIKAAHEKNSRTTYVFDKDKKLINSFGSAVKAAEHYSIPKGSVYYYIRTGYRCDPKQLYFSRSKTGPC